MHESDHFYQLEPNDVMEAVENCGFHPTGQFQQLNSYENRVFDIWLESHKRVIAKFYRPGRWSRDALLDEHQFLHDLQAEGISAVAPLSLPSGETLQPHNGLQLALFPRCVGRMPQEFLEGELQQVGRTLARIHNIGSRTPAEHRLDLHPCDFGWPALELLASWVDRALWPRYEKAATHLLEALEDLLEDCEYLRIHGDCHKGNLLHNGKEFFFVDFDDFANGPVAQDFWMLFSGGEDGARERELILSGYEELRDFPRQQLELLEPLRGLRILHYASWIAKRWEDPSFPNLFPEFNSYSYWAEETEALERITWSL